MYSYLHLPLRMLLLVCMCLDLYFYVVPLSFCIKKLPFIFLLVFCLNKCLINLYFWMLFFLMIKFWDASFSSLSILKLMLCFLLYCRVSSEKSTIICFSVMCLVVVFFTFILRVSEFFGYFFFHCCWVCGIGPYLFIFFWSHSLPFFLSVTPTTYVLDHWILSHTSWKFWFSLHSLSSLYFS